MKYETNIFPIENCHQLTAQYRLFLLIGISETDDEYESHIQYITKKLSYELSHPVTVISKLQGDKRQDYLVIKDDGKTAEQIPGEFDLKRGDSVLFQPTEQVLTLDFTDTEPETRKICRRFLEFALRGSLSGVQALWSPGSGRPYFSKKIYKSIDGVDIYNGFIPKVVDLPNGGWGIALDVTKKYLASKSLPKYMDRHKFNRIKSKHFIYHFGITWYEVKFSDLSDLDASQHTFIRESDGKRVSVIQDLRERFDGRNMPPDLAGLPDDVTLLVYQNNKGEFRRIPSALCYQVLDTEEIGRLHELSISDPFFRRRLIKVARRNYLKNLAFGETSLVIASDPTCYSADCIPFPDQEFRNSRILSVKNTPGASQVAIGQIGERRKALLNDSSVGCYVNEPFEPQYFLMPESIATAFGCTVFLEDLKKAVNRMHPSRKGWNPEVLMYDDRNVRNIHGLAIEILAQIQKNIEMGGYAVIMLPNPASGEHDELAAICVSKCAEMSGTIQVSIMHTDVLKKCIDFQDSRGYVIRKKGLYHGYVRGVALNKVLLNNERWPFVLSDALTADLTIGIDVKKNVAGYIFIDKFGKHILPFRQRSKNRERLSEDKVFAAVVKNVRTLGSHMEIKNIVVHRDGRLFQSEMNGIRKAIDHLIEKGYLSNEAELTVAEIPKHSAFSLRLFDVLKEYNVLDVHLDDSQSVENPRIGLPYVVNRNEGFICTTGREFAHKGSSKPLYLKKIYGGLEIEELLRDAFYLSTLAFTKPDDCSRNPLTIKMTDRLINDFGEQYDEDKLEEAEILQDEAI